MKNKIQNIEIFIADDHTLFRAGIRALIEKLSPFTVTGEACEGLDAYKKIAALQPDVVLMDISMPGINGLLTTEKVKRNYPHIEIIILSMHASEEYVYQALEFGASGYLVKDAALSELEVAIRAVAAGKKYLSPAISHYVMDRFMYEKHRNHKSHPAVECRLTNRQKETLQLIVEGFTTKEIANKLGVSIKTVDNHRTQLMKRLDIHDIAGLVRYAYRNGFVTIE